MIRHQNRCFLAHVAVLLVSVCCSSTHSAAQQVTTPSIAQVTRQLEAGGQTVRIVCFGDSITGVYYHSGSQRAWCDMLGLALQQAYPRAQLEMINAGLSGHTTVNALARIDRDVIAQKPNLVVVMFGMNDVVRVQPQVFQQNLSTIARRCLDSGAAVILCTPNSIDDTSTRTNAGLSDLARRIQQVADDYQLPVVDFFRAWQQARKRDETQWMLMMSDTIHPNMHGHKLFAELIAKTISGRKVSLSAVTPPSDALHKTFDRLRQGQPVKLVAMPPYDKIVPEVLRQLFPHAQFQVTTWPCAGKSVAELSQWAKAIRGMTPHLVVVAVPAAATDQNDAAYIRNYEWVLNWSFQFGRRAWDVVPVLPTVTGPVSDEYREHMRLAREIVLGKDIQFIDRPAGDRRLPKEIVAEWIDAQKDKWSRR